MDLVIQILAVMLGIAGLAGCLLPVLPGPPLSFLGLLLLFFLPDSTMKWSFLLLWGIIAAVVTVLDYLVPAYFTKLTGGSPAATRFALAGMLLGSFLGFLFGIGLKLVASGIMMYYIIVYL